MPFDPISMVVPVVKGLFSLGGAALSKPETPEPPKVRQPRAQFISPGVSASVMDPGTAGLPMMDQTPTNLALMSAFDITGKEEDPIKKYLSGGMFG